LLKTTASCVLASLNASTYWTVRLGISLAAALLDGHFEQPAEMKQALPFQSSFFQMFMIPHISMGCQPDRYRSLRSYGRTIKCMMDYYQIRRAGLPDADIALAIHATVRACSAIS
jgi:hypothetical protein